VVDLIISMKRLTKVLMDRGSSLNIIYVKTLDAMGIDRSRIQPLGVPFHGIVPGKQAILLGQIDLPLTFGDPTNYRMETLLVVGFHGSYHAILG
jgi:ABC-type nitrate/sulfonate/bicarbonate transport system substrate-binding protein